MPYVVLVAVLGAITSSSIALFVLHSGAVIKIASVGAILGLSWAVASLSLRGLPLCSTLEEYRSVTGVVSLRKISLAYANIALNALLVVSAVELPVLLIGKTAVLAMFPVGWFVIISYTLYRAWQIDDRRAFNLDAFQLIGGAGTLAIFVMLLYSAVSGVQAGTLAENISDLDLVKGVFILNACAVPIAIVVAFFGRNIISRVTDMMGLQRPSA